MLKDRLKLATNRIGQNWPLAARLTHATVDLSPPGAMHMA